jgi:hypothetical protein
LKPDHTGAWHLAEAPRARHHGAAIELSERGGRTHVTSTSKYSMPVPLIGALLERATLPVGRYYVRSVLKAAAKATDGTRT